MLIRTAVLTLVATLALAPASSAKSCSASVQLSANQATPCGLAFAVSDSAFKRLQASHQFPRRMTVRWQQARYRFRRLACTTSADLRHGKATYVAGRYRVTQGWRLPHDGPILKRAPEPCGKTGRMVCGDAQTSNPETGLQVIAYRILPTGPWRSCHEPRHVVTSFQVAEVAADGACAQASRQDGCVVETSAGSFTCVVDEHAGSGRCDNGMGLGVSWINVEYEVE
jgi:hypothetical protein